MQDRSTMQSQISVWDYKYNELCILFNSRNTLCRLRFVMLHLCFDKYYKPINQSYSLVFLSIVPFHLRSLNIFIIEKKKIFKMLFSSHSSHFFSNSFFFGRLVIKKKKKSSNQGINKFEWKVNWFFLGEIKWMQIIIFFFHKNDDIIVLPKWIYRFHEAYKNMYKFCFFQIFF